MALHLDVSAPYAPTSTILALLSRNRATGLPSPIDKDALTRLGVTDSLNARTLQALNVLDLINDSGEHTDVLTGLRKAPESEYKDRMAEWLNAAYADILQYVDPAKGDETSVTDAFRPYKPHSMLGRMLTLFTGLYGAAGIWPEDAQKARPVLSARTSASRRPKAGATKTPSVSGTSDRTGVASPPPAKPVSEMAIEYRLVDLMGEASGDQDVMDAIIKIITFLKTRDGQRRQIPMFNEGG